MTERFVPLPAKLSTDSSTESFRVKVLANANGSAVRFQPLAAMPGNAPAPVAHREHPGEAKVSLVRDGDRITAIQVRCACGEVIELQCVY